MTSYLVSYRPLAVTARGRKASLKHGLSAFVDGSCRREPDFESPVPAITSLCRRGKFVPRLCVGDEVIYITVKSSFGSATDETHYRLVAHLRITHISNTHPAAAAWYISQGLAVPSNCMISGSLPKPYDQTNGRNGCQYRGKPEDVKLRWWDGGYRKRAMMVAVVAHCEPLYINLNNPPQIMASDLITIFGRIPGTQTPPQLPCDQIQSLLELAKQRDEPSIATI